MARVTAAAVILAERQADTAAARDGMYRIRVYRANLKVRVRGGHLIREARPYFNVFAGTQASSRGRVSMENGLLTKANLPFLHQLTVVPVPSQIRVSSGSRQPDSE